MSACLIYSKSAITVLEHFFSQLNVTLILFLIYLNLKNALTSILC